VHPPTRSIVDLTPEWWVENELWKGAWLITRINVPNRARGKGIGSHLLTTVTTDADRHGIILVLIPISSATRDSGLPQESLEKWYERNGFDFVGKYMVRYPENPPKKCQ
jgi:GNAT superfamily N-acetyltransferase